jgi:hypothetical protein
LIAECEFIGGGVRQVDHDVRVPAAGSPLTIPLKGLEDLVRRHHVNHDRLARMLQRPALECGVDFALDGRVAEIA